MIATSIPVPDLADGTLAVLIGPPASGKSTFAGQYPASWRVCLDEYRLAATDDMTDQSATPVASQIQELLLDARLARALTTVVDATNVYPHVRRKLRARARYWDCPTAAILFDVPIDVVHARNAGRERTVRRDVLEDLYAQMPTAAQVRAEGFGHVLCVSELVAGDGQ